MQIALLIDNPTSWYVPYAEMLIHELEKRGHEVRLFHTVKELPEGGIAFLLSCEQIIPSEFLKRHRHNIVIHASKVPRGKGWSPMTWQILEGKNEITVSLFEAAERVDSGRVYARESIAFRGDELIGELREKEGKAINALALRFVDSCPDVKGEEQKGKETFYRRRTPEDSELDPNKTLAEQFDLLRVVDNERYPAFFKHRGHTYVLKIYKKEK